MNQMTIAEILREDDYFNEFENEILKHSEVVKVLDDKHSIVGRLTIKCSIMFGEIEVWADNNKNRTLNNIFVEGTIVGMALIGSPSRWLYVLQIKNSSNSDIVTHRDMVHFSRNNVKMAYYSFE